MKGRQIVPAHIAKGVSDSLRFGTTTLHRLKHPIISGQFSQQHRCALAVPTQVRHSAAGPYGCGALLLRIYSSRCNRRAIVGGASIQLRSWSLSVRVSASPSDSCSSILRSHCRVRYSHAEYLVSGNLRSRPATILHPCTNCRSSPRLYWQMGVQSSYLALHSRIGCELAYHAREFLRVGRHVPQWSEIVV